MGRVDRIGDNNMEKLQLDEYATSLCAAVEAYIYPYVTYDFNRNRKIKHSDMANVERLVHDHLFSQDVAVVKDGLSNVIYWGYATQKGRQADRVDKFRSAVSAGQIEQFMSVLNSSDIGVCAIEQIGMPEYSRIAFISKLLMFIDPSVYVVLDNQIADFGASHAIDGLADLKTPTDTSIRSTSKTRSRYLKWASWCRQIAESVNSHPSSPCQGLRAVDVERAIYWNIREGQDIEARLILAGPA